MKYIVFNESASINVTKEQSDIARLELSEAKNGDLPYGIIVDIEASHTTGPTLNNTWYTEKGLRSGIKSWTNPYPKPVLQDHIVSSNGWLGPVSDKGIDPKGRIIGSKLKPLDGIVSEDGSKAYTLALAAYIPGEEDVAKVLDGRYSTVSIGIVSNKVNCSICGSNIAEEYCGHMKGRTYEVERDGKTQKEKCYWLINHTEAVEVSFVNSPADQSAHVTNVRTTAKGDEKLPSIAQSESNSDLFVLTGNNIVSTSDNDATAISLKEAWEQAQSKLTKEQNNLEKTAEFLTVEELEALSLPGIEESNPEVAELVESDEQTIEEESSEATISEGETEDGEIPSSDDLLAAVEGESQPTETEDSTDEEEIKEQSEEKESEDPDFQEKMEELNGKIAEMQEKLDSFTSEKEILVEQNSRLRSALTKMLAEYLTDIELTVGETTAASYQDRYDANFAEVSTKPSDVLKKIHSLREEELNRVNTMMENETLSSEKEDTNTQLNAEEVLQSVLRERKAGIRSKYNRTNQ
jgi:hypothetical protein